MFLLFCSIKILEYICFLCHHQIALMKVHLYFYCVLDKEAADKLSKTVDEACLLLAEYNGRLAAELEDRRQLARMLTEYIGSQKEALVEREKKLDVRRHHCLFNMLWIHFYFLFVGIKRELGL